MTIEDIFKHNGRFRIRVCLFSLFVAGAAMFLGSCRAREIVEEPFEPSSSHAEYRSGLVAMKLDDTALGAAWIAQAVSALQSPLSISLPFREIAQFEPARPEAVGYRFEALRGQRIQISLEIPAGKQGRMFADLFRVDGEEVEAFPQVASYSEELNLLEFEPRRDGKYVLRLQPELLRGGRYIVTIHSVPSMSFPVKDHGTGDIVSFFGDSRDGGERAHEGVDIFAPRGTEVLSSVSGTVRHVGTLDRGGRVVTIVDAERDLIIYYAHLDSQSVSRGDHVLPGDVIGTVGNTGNAIFTPPHLHFGIYESRWHAIDPLNFLYQYETEPPVIQGNLELIGSEVRGLGNGASLRTAGTDVVPDSDETVIVLGASADSYRVLLPERRITGYLPSSVIERLDGMPETSYAVTSNQS